MSRPWLLPCVAALALFGCDDEEECRADTDRIQQRLDALPTGPAPLVPAGIEVPEAEGEAFVFGVPELVIDAEGELWLDGRQVDSLAGVGRALDFEARQRRQMGSEAQAHAVQVWADRSLPYAHLQDVARSLGGREAWLLVTSAQTQAPPPCPDHLGEVCDPPSDPSSRATVLAAAMTEVMEGCEPLTRLFARIATIPGAEKEEAFRREFLPAVRECDCDLDMPAIEYFAVMLAGGSGARVSRIRLTGTGDGTVGDWVASRSGG